MEYDVLVLGCGGSGMFAAIRAAEKGVKRIGVFEKAAAPGGNLRMAGTFFSTDFSDFGDYQSDENSIKLYRKTMKELHLTGNHALIKRYIFRSREIAKFFEERGLKMVPVNMPMFKSDCSRNVESPKEHDLGAVVRLGVDVCNILQAEMEKYPQIETHFKTPAVGLLAENSRVVGANVQIDGETVPVYARTVILATGGCGGSKEAMSHYFPQYMSVHDALRFRGIPTCTGDGIAMAETIGAETGKKMNVHMLGPRYAGKEFSKMSGVMANPVALILDRRGRRLCDETMFGMLQEITHELPGRVIYGLFDQDTFSEAWNAKGFGPPCGEENMDESNKLYAGDIRKGLIGTFDTLDEAAAYMGMAPERLKAAVERYNGFCQTGIDEDEYKDPKYLKPIVKPPFRVLYGARSMDSTQGGITVNASMQAMRSDGTAIQGMFVTGDHVSGFCSQYYAPSGAGMTWAMVSGYMAGEDAAAICGTGKE